MGTLLVGLASGCGGGADPNALQGSRTGVSLAQALERFGVKDEQCAGTQVRFFLGDDLSDSIYLEMRFASECKAATLRNLGVEDSTKTFTMPGDALPFDADRVKSKFDWKSRTTKKYMTYAADTGKAQMDIVIGEDGLAAYAYGILHGNEPG
ncbi:hypothetical protein [Longispora fulva]|uniref:Uncharacterized protein n=1 Tax=Longispora fulva TaxID=619741 RepID=A0A8J7KXH0_9ACTN|nr:hypothetical protein [Longispora fulva]MBG6137822.1 hypothetical protein [Longispora fulva]